MTWSDEGEDARLLAAFGGPGRSKSLHLESSSNDWEYDAICRAFTPLMRASLTMSLPTQGLPPLGAGGGSRP